MKSGTTKKPCFIKVLEMNLPAEILESLLAFQCATGCDTTSQFTSIGKKTAWQVFRLYPHLFNELGEHEIPSGAAVSVVEESVCRLYEPKSTTKSIQTVWCNMFRRLQTKIDSYHQEGVPWLNVSKEHITKLKFGSSHLRPILTCHHLQIVAGTWLIGCSFLCTWQQICFNPIAWSQQCVNAKKVATNAVHNTVPVEKEGCSGACACAHVIWCKEV